MATTPTVDLTPHVDDLEKRIGEAKHENESDNALIFKLAESLVKQGDRMGKPNMAVFALLEDNGLVQEDTVESLRKQLLTAQALALQVGDVTTASRIAGIMVKYPENLDTSGNTTASTEYPFKVVVHIGGKQVYPSPNATRTSRKPGVSFGAFQQYLISGSKKDHAAAIAKLEPGEVYDGGDFTVTRAGGPAPTQEESNQVAAQRARKAS